MKECLGGHTQYNSIEIALIFSLNKGSNVILSLLVSLLPEAIVFDILQQAND